MAAPDVRIRPLRKARAAIDILAMTEFVVLAVAQKVVVGEFDAAGIGAAAAPEVDARLQCPYVMRDDHEVHEAVVIAHRMDFRLAHEAGVLAQVACGLIEPAPGRWTAAPPQQLGADRRLASAHMQASGGAEQPLFLLGIVEIEDLLD